MVFVSNHVVLMIEVAAPDADAAAALVESLPGVTTWGEVDPVQAALLVVDRVFVPAAA